MSTHTGYFNKQFTSGEWLINELDAFQRSISWLRGTRIDEWANKNQAGAVYEQINAEKKYNYIVTLTKRGNLVDFLISKGIADEDPANYEIIARFTPDHILTEKVLTHLNEQSNEIDLTELDKHKPKANSIQLELF